MVKSHQRNIREQHQINNEHGLFGLDITNYSLKDTTIKVINFKTAEPLIKQYEWLGVMPLPKSIRLMVGIYFNDTLGGALVYVTPSNQCYNKNGHIRKVVYLNRGACAYWTPKNTASYLISKSYKLLKSIGIKMIIAFCTPEAGEIGTIYQALNWMYMGQGGKDKMYWLDNRWVGSRCIADKVKWAKKQSCEEWLNAIKNIPNKVVEGKHKYVHFLVNRKEKEKLIQLYKLTQCKYPKRYV
jgi:hypothetical protein